MTDSFQSPIISIMNASPIPRKLNDGMITALSEYVAKGNYASTACQLCGISYQALYNWGKQAEQDELKGLTEETSIYIRLVYALKRAEAEAEDMLVQVVREAGTVKREWLPAMTFLERRHPDRWGRRDRTTVDINETKTITISQVTVVKDYGVIDTPELLEEGND